MLFHPSLLLLKRQNLSLYPQRSLSLPPPSRETYPSLPLPSRETYPSLLRNLSLPPPSKETYPPFPSLLPPEQPTPPSSPPRETYPSLHPPNTAPLLSPPSLLKLPKPPSSTCYSTSLTLSNFDPSPPFSSSPLFPSPPFPSGCIYLMTALMVRRKVT